jgi:hypothetical protein
LPRKSFQPSIGPNQIRDWAAWRWIANGENVLLLGPSGRRQTYLAIALGREVTLACSSRRGWRGSRALPRRAARSASTRSCGAYPKPVRRRVGLPELEPYAAQLFFLLVSRR